MSKRRISQRQAQTIHDHQAGRLERAADETDLGPEESGLVLAHFGKQVEVETQSKEIITCLLRQHVGHLITGDRVIWQRNQSGSGVVVALEPRKSVLTRCTSHGRLKPIAANIDQIFITVALEPAYSFEHLDPYLIAAETLKIKPLILINKIDLCTLPYPDFLTEWIEIYRGLGYPVLEISTVAQIGLAELKEHLQDHVSVFVGQSGVGKSSLMASLLPSDAKIRIGTFTADVGHGTHTTSTARLYHLPSGGDLIDSPGIREFNLGPLDAKTLMQGFIELRPLIGLCKFRDCIHTHEPDCAVLEALEQGKIHPRRLEAFYRLVNK